MSSNLAGDINNGIYITKEGQASEVDPKNVLQIKEPLINHAKPSTFWVTVIPLRFPPMLIASLSIFGVEKRVFPLFQTEFTRQA